MRLIEGRTMGQIIPQALALIRGEGTSNKSITEINDPVAMLVMAPGERVSYGTDYDLNPFVALFTSLWVLGGRNDVEFLSRFDGYQGGMSDDGKVLHGAYGRRVRGHFSAADIGWTGELEPTIDQLKSVIQMLRSHPGHKSAVVSLWDTSADMGLQSRNLPPATQLYFSITDGPAALDMMVMYRNARVFDVRLDSYAFSMMQQFIAESVRVPLGRMTIVANCLGVETNTLEAAMEVIHQTPLSPYPTAGPVLPLTNTDSDEWLAELDMFLDEGPVMGMRDSFFRHVVSPMWQAWGHYTSTAGFDVSGPRKALDTVLRVRARDWKVAARDWLVR